VGGFTIADTTATRIINEEEAYLKVIDYLMIVPVCGGSMHSFIRSLWQTLGGYEYYFGIDGDMTADRRFCALSILKRIDMVMIDYIGMWLQGTMPKHQTLGLADGATDVVVSDYRFSTVYGSETGRAYWDKILNIDSLRQVAIKKEGERYEKK
jgi:basic membrane protein A